MEIVADINITWWKYSNREKSIFIIPLTLCINYRWKTFLSGIMCWYLFSFRKFVCTIKKIKNFKIEIRNRHKKEQSSLVRNWLIYEIKSLRIDLSDKILNGLDQLTIENINKYFRTTISEENLFQSIRFTIYKNTPTKKKRMIW